MQVDLPPADFVSLVTSAVLVEAAAGIDVFAESGGDRRRTVADYLAALRRDDGGYAKTRRGPSSTYQTFLALGCRQLAGVPVDDAGEMAAFVRSRQRDDGGFVEIDAARTSGTNPTAAAVAVLRALDGLTAPVAAAAGRFLGAMQTSRGACGPTPGCRSPIC